MRSYLSHLECTETGETYNADEPHNLSPAAQKVLYPRYDIDAVRREVDPSVFASRPPSIWRWFELMPVRDESNVVTLGRGRHADDARLEPREVARRPHAVSQGRRAEPHGHVQGARAVVGGVAGEGAGADAADGAVRGQRGRRAGVVLRPGRHGGLRVHAGGRSSRGEDGGRARGLAPDAGEGAHQRRGQALPREGRRARPVRRFDAAGAVPHRGEEDDRVRDRGVAGLASA